MLHLRHQIKPRKSRPTRLDDVFGTHTVSAPCIDLGQQAIALRPTCSPCCQGSGAVQQATGPTG
jgi:hypothetical protein